jgi:hypothetical protein
VRTDAHPGGLPRLLTVAADLLLNPVVQRLAVNAPLLADFDSRYRALSRQAIDRGWVKSQVFSRFFDCHEAA